MKYQRIECELVIDIVGKRDCAHHQKLGWSKTAWHKHNRGQLLYAENGIMRLYIGTEVYYIPSYHAAWIPQGEEHVVITESKDLVFRTLYLDHSQQSDPFYKKVCVFHVSHLLKKMIEHSECWPLMGDESEEEQSFLHAIKLMLPMQAKDQINMHIPATENDTLNDILQYIEINIENLPNASAVSKEHSMSARTMQRLFVKELKMPYIEYIKLYRIGKALELLTSGEMNVSDVADQVGYNSLASFSNVFYDVIRKRPQYFLKKNR